MSDTILPNELPDDFPERYRDRKVYLRFIPEPDTRCGFNDAPDEVVVVQGGNACPGGLLVFGRHDAYLNGRRWEPNSGERYAIRHLLGITRQESSPLQACYACLSHPTGICNAHARYPECRTPAGRRGVGESL